MSSKINVLVLETEKQTKTFTTLKLTFSSLLSTFEFAA